MYEVELKVRADHGRVREALADLGTSQVDAVEQVDTYYDHPGRDFAATDEALRLRRVRPLDGDGAEGGAAEGAAETRLTYKGPLVDETTKTREEFETGVADGSTAGTILERLDFTPAATVRKRRRRFERGAYTVTLDSVDELGEFVEVEREVSVSDEGDGADSAAVDRARDEARDLLRALGLDPDDGIRTSYLGLLLEGRAD